MSDIDRLDATVAAIARKLWPHYNHKSTRTMTFIGAIMQECKKLNLGLSRREIEDTVERTKYLWDLQDY